MSKPLTNLHILNAKPGLTRREMPDGKIGGLYLVVQPSGAKSWALRYRVSGRPTKLTLGAFPAIDLSSARALAQRATGEIAQGGDPAARKKTERAAAKAARAEVDDLVEKVVDDFIKLYAARHTRDWKETARLLKKDVVPTWRGKRLADIEKKHVVKLLDVIVERGAPIGANRTFAQLRKMCSWAVSRGIIDRSPCEGVKPPSAEIERDRVLTHDELALIWRATAELTYPYDKIIRLLVLTGQRRDEVAGLRWSEVDLDDRTWTLPKERSKNRREHVIPLTPPAMELLSSLPRIDGSPFAFGGGRAAPSAFSKAKSRLDATVARLNGGDPISHWTFHDLRRTVATRMAELQIAPHVVEAVLNHQSGVIRGVAAIYNRYSYLAEKRAALEAWATTLQA
jgi:integrase